MAHHLYYEGNREGLGESLINLAPASKLVVIQNIGASRHNRCIFSGSGGYLASGSVQRISAPKQSILSCFEIANYCGIFISKRNRKYFEIGTKFWLPVGTI